MLIRTNIYLEPQIITAIKSTAQEQDKTMAEIIREILKKALKEEKKDWAKSLHSLANKAGRSGLGDLAKRHDKYLYEKR